ncbi:MAG: SUMF1/EgtB/PvdO family nonheme iron enzyme [Chloroflexi bacterium]|nr:SUMF1/EgtB/PvdO family nonheme iron enzyme [Chloroflexota bacterium]
MSHPDQTTAETTPFLSLMSVRDTHSGLLQRRRQGEDEAFYTAVTQFMQRAQTSGIYLDNDSDRWAVQTLIDYWENQLYHAGLNPPAESLLAEFDPTTEPELPDELCPYVGLGAFQPADGPRFFGREDLVADMLHALQNHRLVTVLGPSGSGKSSIVLAGLLPRLAQASPDGGAPWRIYPVLKPGSTPLAHLALLLKPDGLDPGDWLIDTVEQLRQDAGQLTKLIQAAGEQTAVLVIDQFEETFTLCQDEAERQAFLDNLLRLTQSSGQRHTVILTMRTDYEGQLSKYPVLQTAVAACQIRVTAMNAGELRSAIEKPAESIGLKFEEGLVDALIREILGEPAALPLLQFALLQLWENRERRRITWEAYRRIGGVMAALDNTAEALYNNMIPEDQVATRRLMLRLVQVGQGLEVTRNRVRRRALYQAGEAHDRIDRVLDKLVQAQLVHLSAGTSAEDDQLEVAHEALVRNWPRLVDWLDEERIHLRQRHRLTTQADAWTNNNKNRDLLLRGPALEEALQFSDLNPLEQAFIEASQAEKQRIELEKEKQRQRERRFSLMLGIFAIVAIIGVLFLFQANQTAGAAQATANAAQFESLAAQLTADALAQKGTRESGYANATSTVASGTATSQADTIATSQAQNEIRMTEEARATNEAIWAASTAQAEAIATATAAAEATATRSGDTQRPTATPGRSELDTLYLQNAQLGALFRDRDNMLMLYITGNTFLMGGLANDPDKRDNELPLHKVSVPDFYLDAYEVSVQQYASFLNAIGGYKGKCGDGRHDCVATGFETSFTMLLNNVSFYEPKAGFASYPINWVSWYGANDYCQWVNARLPSEAEWEYAARSVNGRLFPWGDTQPTRQLALFGINPRITDYFQALKPVNAYPDGVSLFGAYNMGGSMWEWVADWYTPNYLAAPADGSAFLQDLSGQKVIRGGGWTSPAGDLRTARRVGLPPVVNIDENSLLYWSVGFRCARDVQP